MNKYLKISAAIAICLFSVAVTRAEEVDFTRHRNGELYKTKSGENALRTKADYGPRDVISIPLAKELEPGWWKFTLEFDFTPGCYPGLVLGFDNTGRIEHNFYATKDKMDFIFKNAVPVKQLVLRIASKRNKPSLGVKKISFEPISASDIPVNLPIAMELKSENNRVFFPAGSPTGVYYLNLGGNSYRCYERGNDKPFVTSPENFQPGLYLTRPDFVESLGRPMPQLVKATYYPADGKTSPWYDGEIIPAVIKGKYERIPLVFSEPVKIEDIKAAPYPAGKKVAMITSWDDGVIQDHILLELAKKYNFRATLMLNNHSAILSDLSPFINAGLEIGSHSWNHPRLGVVSPERARAEIVEFAKKLCGKTGKPVISFAYPFNYTPAYDRNGNYVLNALKEAGHWSARATSRKSHTIYDLDQPLIFTPDFHFLQDPEAIRRSLDKKIAADNGGIMYVWGHSYELDNGGREKFEKLLKLIANDPNVWYVTQGEFAVARFNLQNVKIERDQNGNLFLVRPLLHPSLRKQPVFLKVPAGVKSVKYADKVIPVKDGIAELTGN